MFTEVSREIFYATVGPLNVHPRVVSGWHSVTGYTSDWVLQNSPNGTVIGRTDGQDCLKNKRYFLRES